MEGIPIEQIVHDHEKRILILEQSQGELKTKMEGLAAQVAEGNIRSEEGNKYLQSQNTEMFKLLVGVNDKVQDRKHEIKLLNKQNLWKLVFILGGGAGVVSYIVQAITKYIAKH